MNAYEKFADYVLTGDIYAPAGFRQVCRRLGISASAVDEVMEEELGMGGEEFLFSCRKCI